ncbi:MAG: hypothetical protein JOY89_21925 [Solirubrobacterales bacterium]|nr:hypothetical protein [Solirubrobacterales bacterium]
MPYVCGGRQHGAEQLCRRADEDPEFVAAATQLATIADRDVLSPVTETPCSP